MAVENKYVDSNIVAGKKALASASIGAKDICLVKTFEIAVADDDGSVYRIFPDVPANYIPTEISIMCDTITAGTDFDLGLHKTDGGAVINADLFMDGQTLATALTRATGHQLGLAAINIADAEKTLAVLSAQTKPDAAYDITLTGNTVGSAAGTVTIIARFVQN